VRFFLFRSFGGLLLRRPAGQVPVTDLIVPVFDGAGRKISCFRIW